MCCFEQAGLSLLQCSRPTRTGLQIHSQSRRLCDSAQILFEWIRQSSNRWKSYSIARRSKHYVGCDQQQCTRASAICGCGDQATFSQTTTTSRQHSAEFGARKQSQSKPIFRGTFQCLAARRVAGSNSEEIPRSQSDCGLIVVTICAAGAVVSSERRVPSIVFIRWW